jgi:hypothetical protein
MNQEKQTSRETYTGCLETRHRCVDGTSRIHCAIESADPHREEALHNFHLSLAAGSTGKYKNTYTVCHLQ